MSGDKLKPPKKTAADQTHAIAKATLAAVPYVGGTAAELFQLAIAPSIERRRDEWMERVAEALQDLEKKVDGLSIETLRDNPEFITIVTQATRAALTNHHEEKLQALQNAILNVAAGTAPGDFLQQVFIRYVDELSPLHISMLRFFHNPKEYFAAVGKDPPNISLGGVASLIEAAMPQLRGRREVYDQIGRELMSRGLLSNANFHVTMTGTGLFQKGTTTTGDEFLTFITAPRP